MSRETGEVPVMTSELRRRLRRDSDRRRRLRRTLEAKGFPPDEVERLVARKAAEQKIARDILRQRGDTPRVDLDDTGYKPTYVDPLLKGVARATGQTAKAVKRGTTVTRHQHQEADRG